MELVGCGCHLEAGLGLGMVRHRTLVLPLSIAAYWPGQEGPGHAAAFTGRPQRCPEEAKRTWDPVLVALDF